MAPGLLLRRNGVVAMVVAVVFVFGAVGGVEMVKDGVRHHVVGGDQGWDVASNLAKWSMGRVFRDGDNIWFTFSAAMEGVAELRSKQELDSCDLRNPIRMYTDGLHKVVLNGVGPRYFVSINADSCNDGLKLHVNVLPRGKEIEQKAAAASERAASDISALAAGPTPSSTARVPAPVWLGFALLFLVGFQSVRV